MFINTITPNESPTRRSTKLLSLSAMELAVRKQVSTSFEEFRPEQML
jgi:hypothetical protein